MRHKTLWVVLLAAVLCGVWLVTYSKHSTQQLAGQTLCTTLTLHYPMSLGSTDATTEGEVSKLQTYLLAWGKKYHIPEAQALPVTGYFGTQTQDALRGFQMLHNIPSNTSNDNATTLPWDNSDYGVVGPRTRSLLSRICAEGGLANGNTSAPRITIESPTSGTYSLSQPIIVHVTLSTITFNGTVNVYLVPLADKDTYQLTGRVVAQTDGIRDGFSGPLSFTVSDYFGYGLPQSGESHEITPGGPYAVVATVSDGMTDANHLPKAISAPIYFTK